MHLYARLTLFIGYSLRLYCGGKLVLDPSRMITCIVPSITFSLIFTKPLCECQYWITKTLCLICVEPSLAGCIILVVLIWCRRRWRNNVPIWGRHWNTNLIYLSFLCYIVSIHAEFWYRPYYFGCRMTWELKAMTTDNVSV